MIVRTLRQIQGTTRDVAWGNGQSRRFLIAADSMGYSLTDTTVKAGTASELQYTQHMEACYCIEGEGEIEKEGKIWKITPGTMYALDQHDKHTLRATTDLRLICVFLPALRGEEIHDLTKETSSY